MRTFKTVLPMSSSTELLPSQSLLQDLACPRCSQPISSRLFRSFLMESFPLTLITSPQSRAVANFMRVSSICPSQLSDKEDGCQSRSLNTLVTETQKNGNQETTTSVPSHPIGVANSWSLIQTVKS